MKRFTKFCLILAAILILIGLGAGIAGYAGGAISEIRQQADGAEAATTIDLPGEACDTVSISLTWENVTLAPSPDQDIHITYTPTPDCEYRYETETKTTDGSQTLHFYSTQNSSHDVISLFRFDFGTHSGDDEVLVQLPASLSVQIGTTSGDVMLRDLSLEQVSLSSTSGELSCSDSTVSGSASCCSVSGKVLLSQTALQGGLSCGTTSGEIRLSTLTQTASESVTLSTVSGAVNVAESTLSGPVMVESTSGEVSMDACTIPRDISIETVSGAVVLHLQDAASHYLDRIETLSGTVVTTGDDRAGQYGISVSTTSGNINIREA